MTQKARLWLPWILILAALAGCAPAPQAGSEAPGGLTWGDLTVERSMELLYADQFSVDYCQDGYKKISIGEESDYLIVPEGAEVPTGVPDEVTVIRQPLDDIYLVATSAMDLFRELDALENISLSGTDASGWYIEEARQAMEDGSILYAGKYSAPDYELILDQACDLAVESTMIYHAPEVMEQLERLGVPVLVERSSYESHPFGRMEWLKLYGALLNKEEEAKTSFDSLIDDASVVMDEGSTEKTVTFFYITSSGAVNVRRSGDYIARAIEIAGGDYVPDDLDEENNELSTMNIQMETFYEQARDADILIYNSTIDGELETVDQLLEKNALLADFKAVQEGNAWCSGKNLFQESLGLSALVRDLHEIMTEDEPQTTYLQRLS